MKSQITNMYFCYRHQLNQITTRLQWHFGKRWKVSWRVYHKCKGKYRVGKLNVTFEATGNRWRYHALPEIVLVRPNFYMKLFMPNSYLFIRPFTIENCFWNFITTPLPSNWWEQLQNIKHSQFNNETKHCWVILLHQHHHTVMIGATYPSVGWTT